MLPKAEIWLVIAVAAATCFFANAAVFIEHEELLKEIPENITKRIDNVTIESDVVDVNGVEVSLLETFPPCEDCPGQSILLLHGAAYNKETWRSTGTLKYLAAMGHHVIAINLPSGRKVGDKAEFMHNLVKALEIEKPVVLSPSYSGGFAIPYFVKYHEEMGAYVPVAPGAASTLNKPKTIEILKKIKTPVLNLVGERDGYFVQFSKRIFGHVENFAHLEVKGGSHAFYIKHHKIFHTALYNFLKKLPSSD